MADGEVKIDTKLDNSGIDKGLKDMKNKLDGAGKTLSEGAKKGKGFADNLKGISTGAVAAAGAVAGVAVAVKKTVDVLDDCAAAYRVQTKAEEALQTAANNNPYLNDESVYNLRNFASELQSMSEIGDEVSLRVMSQLAATGRTEEQIMQIMSAAADMAAVTGNSIQNVALQLNKTYSGLAGELGEANGAIRALTKEELENGRAIELVAKQYKGAAAATADVEVQLSNAWGDFKENIGRGWQNVTQPVKQFFLNILDNINEATAKTRALEEMSLGQSQGAFTAEQLKALITEKQEILNKALEEENNNLIKSQNRLKEWAEYWGMNINDPNLPALPPIEEFSGAVIKAATNTELLRIELEQLKKEYDEVAEKEKAAADAAVEQAKAEDRAAAQKRDDEATTYINANTKALQEQIKAIQLKASITGEEIDAGEMYNAYLQSYIDLITKSNGLVTENNQAAKNRLATLRELAEAAKTATDKETKLANAQKMQDEATALMKDIDGGKHKTAFDEYDEKNKQLEEWRKKVDQYEKDGVMSAQEAADAKLEIDRQYWQNKKDLAETMTAEINGYIQQTTDIAKEAGDLMLENLQSQTNSELMELDKKYEAGEMSEEEYYEKQKQIQQKAAREEYKIKMFQWTASMLAATANIAEGVSKAIAQGGVAGIVTGALVAAAGGVQLASIFASKPTPPNFYKGGVIGGANGATMGSDNTYIHARTGEMVLNAHQQRSLWNMINGQDSRQQARLNLTVNNTQSNKVDTQIREENGAVILDIVDKRVNKGFIDGTFDGGYASMLARQEGERIL